MYRIITILIQILILTSCVSQQNINDEVINLKTSPENGNTNLEVSFKKGKYFNHPSFAIWTEDLEGNYIETLYVTRFVGTGIFGHGELEPGKWSDHPGNVRRPASLPYWAHKRNIKAADGLFVPSPETAVPDALTSATPTGNFNLETATKNTNKFRLLLEINQPWDSNKFWTNNKFTGDLDYLSSLQPALVYAVIVDPYSNEKEYYLSLIGHSEPSGKNGTLYTDLTTLTTAKEIAEKIVVHLK